MTGLTGLEVVKVSIAVDATVCGYCDGGLSPSVDQVRVRSSHDPICALQACVEKFQVAAVESVASGIDTFVPLTGIFNVTSRWTT